MSSALAVAAITAALKHVLENGLIDRAVTASVGGDTTVSAIPPDRIATGADEQSQLNLFLYRITPNTGMRRLALQESELPREHIDAQSLALDLHYLLTAYGAQDFHIEILLGHAIQLLHATPTLQRSTIRAALSRDSHNSVLPAAVATLAAADLGEQLEQISVSPQFLSSDEMSRIWSSLQARYRPSVAYKVSLVIIGGPATKGKEQS